MDNQDNTPHYYEAPQRPDGRSLFDRVARRGLSMGLYLIALALFSAMSMNHPFTGMLVWIGSLYLPFYLYKIMLSGYAESRFDLRFSEIWAEGLITLFLGTALQALFIYVGLRYISPDYISTLWHQSLDAMRSMNDQGIDQMIAALEELESANGLPTPVDVMTQTITTNLFFGMILTLIEAALIYTRYSNPERRNRYLSQKNKN